MSLPLRAHVLGEVAWFIDVAATSGRGKPAVQDQHRADSEAGLVGCEIHDGCGDLFGAAQPANWKSSGTFSA
jgi:hypothetical protein